MSDPVKTPHEWVTSRLGHGEWQCVHCFATNREIAVIGDPNHCPDAHEAKAYRAKLWRAERGKTPAKRRAE